MSLPTSQFSLEIPMRCSPSLLFEYLTTPNGLQEWFADKVAQDGEQFTFTWNGSDDEALRIESVEDELVRYKWDYAAEGEFFEFKIEQSPITNETILRITDFADSTDMEGQKQLWEAQIAELKHRIGS